MARVIYWQPMHNRDGLQNQLDRLFASSDKGGDRDWVKSQKIATAFSPRIEWQDTKTALILRAEIPGTEAKDIDVQVSRDAVAIAGERRCDRAEKSGNYRSEIHYGQFRRVVKLPVPVLNDQVQAELKDGILTLTLPKLSSVRPTVVKVNLAEEQTTAPVAEAPGESDRLPDKGAVGAIADPELLEDVWATTEAA